MRGVDTNVLLRYLTRDDPRQASAAKAFLEESEKKGERLFVATAVLCELAWTLRGSRYGYDRHAIGATIGRILETRLFEVEARDVVHAAVSDYLEERGDFADFLIGRQGLAAGCSDTVTFDRQLRGSAPFTVLE